MADTTSDNQSIGDGIDLSQFYQVFFEEAGENLEQMEQKLLELDVDAADDEELNAIFRCAHSVKGGAATFGFSDVAELTHHMETLLDTSDEFRRLWQVSETEHDAPSSRA